MFFPPYSFPDLNNTPQKTVFIPKGSSLRGIANVLGDSSVLKQKEIFILLGKVSGYQNRLKAGLFKIPENLHPWHLLNYLLQPKSADVKVTFPEGIQASDMAGILKKRLMSDSTRFMKWVNDSALCHSLGVKVDRLEGYLLPETYYFTVGMDEKDIVRLLVHNTLSIFEADSIRFQMENLGMDRSRILTLASIIEGEVVVDSERATVSSVYHNRLRHGWLLGADPTIQYIIPGPPRRLLLKDLEIDSPYNTYLHRGLPPGPINNPGKRSILAALYPAKSRYIYFVANGDGGHYFSRTSAEHAQRKAQFDKVRREVRRNKRR